MSQAPLRPPALLLLEDGSFFEGVSVGHNGTTAGEICFNTGMTGYQEIYTDPSYFGQIIVNTTSHIGNYGVHDAEVESGSVKFAGLVCKSFSAKPSRLSGSGSLQDYLDAAGIVGIAEIDTRQLVRHIRSKGAMNAIISSVILDKDELAAELKKCPSMDGLELCSKVSSPKVFDYNEGGQLKVAVLDLGIKLNILRSLERRGVQCRVFPAKTPLAEMKAWEPDGFFISNGPGDPAVTSYATDTVKGILSEKKPLFGICMGHQILAQAAGIPTFKMHHGHRGLNHPVKNLERGTCEVTSQNHGFSVDAEALAKSDRAVLTHQNLNDGTVEGIRIVGAPAFSVQYHPEAAPGPHDSHYLFDQFVEMLQFVHATT